MGASEKSLDRNNELLSSIKEAHGPRKDSRPSEGLDTHVFQRTSPKIKAWLKKQKNFVRGPEEKVTPKEGQQCSERSSFLYKQ
ncbi:hypothetical protein O181_039026 [Austropuccinia psidii MF-1]|uniref:Uncharacterized protein n=1 Tax=Austropuccinia psidii MF-1 TaxID=1389203 RepID=A0A9Q3DF45_9BASI|nr:hypothetical protein [Austropuccinia psidii MF-1]